MGNRILEDVRRQDESVAQMIERRRAEQAAEEKAKGAKMEEIRQHYEGLAEKRKQEQERAQRQQQEQRELALRQRQERAEAEIKAQALASWKRAGGDDASFESAWPDLRKELLAKQVAEDMRQAQLASARQTRARF